MNEELLFAESTMIFLLIGFVYSLCINIANRIPWKTSKLRQSLSNFSRKHPQSCGQDNSFYCFFNRKVFTNHS
jgi:hypothetical protein